MTAPRIEESGEVLWLDNGLLRLGLVPQLGGRLLSLAVPGGPELLWRNDELLSGGLETRSGHHPHGGSLGDWLNYGGDKTWPAPQGWSGPGEWAGPPDPVLDSGRYQAVTAVTDDAVTVTLTSGDDPRTGLRLSREFVLERGRRGYTLELTARNTADRPVRWALWNVTQLAADGPGQAEVAGPPEVVGLLAGTGFPAWERAGDRVRVPHQDVVGKLGFPAATGLLTHVGAGGTLTQAFAVADGAEYPDQGSRAEIWTECPLPAPLAELGDLDPPARIVEIEVLGPLTTLAPGEETGLTIDCTVEAEDAR
ncbi:DUF4380 domain-containing protein [Amycolatopsis magusensis]|uniref:DUF4380 domain-containing protein n=1 Tax=Amycolatopsis magusensis TaxID=882444 RepID=UPI003C2C66DA